jgi:hypothetical protein
MVLARKELNSFALPGEDHASLPCGGQHGIERFLSAFDIVHMPIKRRLIAWRPFAGAFVGKQILGGSCANQHAILKFSDRCHGSFPFDVVVFKTQPT